MKRAIAHAVYLVVGMGVLLGLVSFFGARPLMTLLRTPENIIDGSVTYIKIVGGLTLAQMAYNGVSSVLRAIGDSRTPLYFLIFSSLLNVGLDLAFVLGLNAGVAGVAYATVISQAVSAILCLIYMVKRYPRLVPDREAWRFDSRVFGDYARIGVPMVVQSIVLNVGMFVITAVINSFGSDTVAAYTIGSKVEQLAMITFSNVAFSFSVYSGQNFGARRYDRIKEGLKRGILLVAGLALVSTVVMMIFARPLALIFMEEENATVLERAVAMIRIEAAFFVMLGSIWAVTSTLRGMGAIKVTLVSSVIELVSKIGFSLLLPLFLGYIGVWLAAPLGWILGLIPPLAYLLWWAKNPQERSEQLRGSKEKKE